MKNINKILSVILTLALLAGSLVMAIPASAAETGPSYDAWANAYEFPPVVMGGDTNVFSIAADGTTMFLWSPLKTALAKAAVSADKTIYVSNTDGFPKTGTILVGGITSKAYTAKTADSFTFATGLGADYAVKAEVTTSVGGLFKSTDAGKTWSGSNLTAPAAAAITMLKVCPTDTLQLVATDGTDIYRSVNGGKDWFVTIVPAVGTPIVAIDIVKNDDGTQILAAGAGGVAKLDANVGGWANLPAITGVFTAAFSPDYINDEQVLAVAVVGGNTILTSNFKGDATWGATTSVATLKNNNTDNVTAITSACLAFPSDYYWGSTNQVFVGITDAGIAGDVYRVNGALAGNAASVRDLGVDADVISLAVSGTKADSTVIASLTGAGLTLSTNADTASTPDWSSEGIKKPYANGAVLALASTGILYAGDNSAHSSFYQATADFKSFNGISRTEVTNIYTYDFSRGVVKDPSGQGNKFSYYFKLVGTNWELRYVAGDATKPGFAQNPASVRGSNVMYAVLNTNTKQIIKTIDGGLNWTTIAAPGNKAITTITVVTDDLYYIGYTGKIRSNTGSELDLAGVSQDPSTIAMVGTTGILVGTNGRIPSTWLYSNDSGATFKVLGTQDKFTGAKAQKYIVSQNTIYVVDSTGVLWTYNLATDTDWQKEKSLTSGVNPIPAADLTSIKVVNVVSDVLFIGIAKVGVPQIYRSLPTTDGTFDFRVYPNTINTELNGTLDGLNVFDNGDGTFNVKPALVDLTITYPAHGIAGIERVYTDTTAGQLVTTSPAADAQINNPVDLSWKAPKTAGTVTFKYEVARDADFEQIVATATPTTTTVFSVAGGNLVTGIKYFWRVCVNGTANTTLNGLWSETQSFTVKTIGNVNTQGIGRPESVYPAQGAIAISTTPVLTWGVVAGATYNVKIATDSAFTNVIDSKDGLTVAVYTPAKALTPNTVYFWEVQAVAGGVASDWVAFAFTTASDATPTGTVTPPVTTIINPTPVVTVTIPPAAPPATPAYIWFIIVIGAVLVIAVIVLIVRTRRV